MNAQNQKIRARIIKERQKRRIKANKKHTLSRIFNKTTAVAAFTFVSNMFSANAPKIYASENTENTASTEATEAFANKFSPANFSRFTGDIELDKKSSLETLMLDQGVSPEVTTELKNAFSSVVNLEEISGDYFNYEIVQNDQDSKIARATIKYKLKTTTKKSNLPKTKNEREITIYGYTDKDGNYKYYSPDGADIESRLALPLDDKYIDISSPFDLRRFHPVRKKILPHEGVDIRAARGTPVRAPADGKVKFRGVKEGYGNNLVLDNGQSQADEKIETLYGHLHRFAVKEGQEVKKGEVIGYVGNTGIGTGNHLHYEVRINGVPVDPLGERAAQITFHKINDDKLFQMTVAGTNSVSERLASGINFVAVSKIAPKSIEIGGLDIEAKMIKDKTDSVKIKLFQANVAKNSSTPMAAKQADKNRRTAQTRQTNIALKQYKSTKYRT